DHRRAARIGRGGAATLSLAVQSRSKPVPARRAHSPPWLRRLLGTTGRGVGNRRSPDSSPTEQGSPTRGDHPSPAMLSTGLGPWLALVRESLRGRRGPIRRGAGEPRVRAGELSGLREQGDDRILDGPFDGWARRELDRGGEAEREQASAGSTESLRGAERRRAGGRRAGARSGSFCEPVEDPRITDLARLDWTIREIQALRAPARADCLIRERREGSPPRPDRLRRPNGATPNTREGSAGGRPRHFHRSGRGGPVLDESLRCLLLHIHR